MSRNDTRIYVGNLPPDVRSKEVEELFRKYGKISYIDLKSRRGPPFAFVEFNESRDARDAVKGRDQYDYDGYRLRVEFPKGRERGPGGIFKSDGGVERGGRRGASNRRSNYRLKVTGLPPTGSWQDLKDHMREIGEVCYADVFKDGTGVVEFAKKDDMLYALKKMDESRFRSHEGEITYIHLEEDSSDSRGHSRSNTRSRSRSRSPYSRRSRGSPTYSPNHSQRSRSSGSGDRSRSRSLDSGHDVAPPSRSMSRSRSPSDKSNRSRSRSRSASRSRSFSRTPSRSRSR